MLFSRKQREQINSKMNKAHTGLVQEGRTVTRAGTACEVPNILELRKQATEQLAAEGFEIRQVSPKVANLIVRVYCDKGLRFGGNQYWAYGVEVFTKGLWKMRTTKAVKSAKDSIYDRFRNYVSIRIGPYKTVIKNVKNFADYHFLVTK